VDGKSIIQGSSKASLNYKKAFPKHDPTGYAEFILKVKKGEAKINASALFPYEIVAQAMGYNTF